MKKILLIFVIFNLNSQENELKLTKEIEHFYLEVGLYQPMGNLLLRHNEGMNFGFWYRDYKMIRNYLEFGFSFFVPSSAQNFIINYEGSLYETKLNNFGGMIGVRFCEQYAVNQNIFIEPYSSFGLGLQLYELSFRENPYNCGENKDEKCPDSDAFITPHLGLGIRLKINNLGFYSSYNLTPYHLFNNRIDQSFGSHFLTFGIVYYQ